MNKLLFFHAPWCPPCKFFEREFIRPLEKEVGTDNIKRINVVDEPELADRYGITRLPRAMLVASEKVIDSAVGFSDFERCKKVLGGYYEKG